MNKIPVAIVIPIYKDCFTWIEEIALKRCFQVLHKYPIFIVKPQSLVLNLEHFDGISSLKFIELDDSYFEGIAGYNKMMLSEIFYNSFINYEFILIHQLDCFVFTDNLKDWVEKSYDYVGAPWFSGYKSPDMIKSIKEKLRKRLYILINKKDKNNKNFPHAKQFSNTVGNGGFSLRRVSKFLKICKKFKPEIQMYLSQKSHYFNEDVFFSIEVNRFKSNLTIPNYKLASTFSLENSPDIGLEINKGQLPFGCHDWEEYISFWRPYFASVGYVI